MKDLVKTFFLPLKYFFKIIELVRLNSCGIYVNVLSDELMLPRV